MHAWAKVCHLSQSNKSVLIGFLSRCMQYWLKNHWPGFVQTLHVFMHTTVLLIQQSWTIIVLLLSDLCTCVQVFLKTVLQSCSSSVTALWGFKVAKKRWAATLLSVNCCCSVQNHPERVTQFWTSPSEDPCWDLYNAFACYDIVSYKLHRQVSSLTNEVFVIHFLSWHIVWIPQKKRVGTFTITTEVTMLI